MQGKGQRDGMSNAAGGALFADWGAIIAWSLINEINGLQYTAQIVRVEVRNYCRLSKAGQAGSVIIQGFNMWH